MKPDDKLMLNGVVLATLDQTLSDLLVYLANEGPGVMEGDSSIVVGSHSRGTAVQAVLNIAFPKKEITL